MQFTKIIRNENLGIDWVLQALITEVARLEVLYRKLNVEDQAIVRKYSIRLNKVVLGKIRDLTY